MTYFEILDGLIKTLEQLRKETITKTYGGFSDPYFTFNKKELQKTFSEHFEDIEKDKLLSAVKKLEDDNLISIPNKNAVPLTVIFNYSFFEALEINKGWYTTNHYKKEIELELLTTRLEKLSLEIRNLESTDSTLKDKLPIITSVSSAIASTLDLISKINV